MLRQQFNQTSVVRYDVNGPGFDLGQHTLMEVGDLEGHAWMLANTLTLNKRSVCLLTLELIGSGAVRFSTGPFSTSAAVFETQLKNLLSYLNQYGL